MSEILTGIVSFIAGLATGYVIRIRIDSRKNTADSSTRVTQRDVVAGGHVAGRDINDSGTKCK